MPSTLRKILALSLAGLILLFLGFSFFTPDHIRIETQCVVPMSKELLFEELKSLESQSQLWLVGHNAEEVSIEGADGEVGAEMIIIRQDGRIRQRISKIVEGERLETELWISTFTGQNISYFQLENIGEDSTLLTWGILGTHSFPTDVLARISGADEDLKNIMSDGLEAMREDMSAS